MTATSTSLTAADLLQSNKKSATMSEQKSPVDKQLQGVKTTVTTPDVLAETAAEHFYVRTTSTTGTNGVMGSGDEKDIQLLYCP